MAILSLAILATLGAITLVVVAGLVSLWMPTIKSVLRDDNYNQ